MEKWREWGHSSRDKPSICYEVVHNIYNKKHIYRLLLQIIPQRLRENKNGSSDLSSDLISDLSSRLSPDLSSDLSPDLSSDKKKKQWKLAKKSGSKAEGGGERGKKGVLEMSRELKDAMLSKQQLKS